VNLEPLVQGRDRQAGTDAGFDAMLGQTFAREQQALERPSPPGTSSREKPSVECIRTAQTPPPPLLRAYLVVCAALLLALIQIGCDAHRLTKTSPATNVGKVEHVYVASEQSAPQLATTESNFAPAESMTCVREDEPTIEVTGPLLADPFADWAPRAVLERLPAPRAELIRLPITNN
jgi:hypothetical protein